MAFSDLNSFPPELLRAVEIAAEDDATHTCRFLDSIGVKAGPSATPLPANWLLDLAAALRLKRWEAAGFRPQEFGLPGGSEAMRAVAGSVTDSSGWGRLARRVMVAQVEHFSWSAPDVLNADVRLSADDADEAVLDELAILLWRHRTR